MRLLLLIPLVLILAAFGGCGDDEHGHDHDGHDHGDHSHEGHDHSHEGHDHGHDHGDHDHDDGHGKAHELGSLKAGDVEFSVQQFGDIGSEGVFTLTAASGNVGDVRIWIGAEDGRGSVKALLTYDADDKHYHGHVEVPAKLADGSAVWVSISKDGKTSSGSIAYHK